MSNREKRTHAFTLIELLVVIAIIALLLAIVMPGLRKVKDQARAVVCQSNLRQWHLCWKTYLQENDDKFAVIREDGAPSRWHEWIYRLKPYYQDDGVFTCPAAAKAERVPGVSVSSAGMSSGSYMGTLDTCWRAVPVLDETPGEEIHDGSYGMNYWVSNQTVNLGGLNKRNFWGSDVSTGSSGENIPLFADSIWTGFGPQMSDNPRMAGSETGIPNSTSDWTHSQAINRMLLKRHNSRYTQVVFLDGHAEKVTMVDAFGLKWHRNWNIGRVDEITWDDYPWAQESSR